MKTKKCVNCHRYFNAKGSQIFCCEECKSQDEIMRTYVIAYVPIKKKNKEVQYGR